MTKEGLELKEHLGKKKAICKDQVTQLTHKSSYRRHSGTPPGRAGGSREGQKERNEHNIKPSSHVARMWCSRYMMF